MSAPRALKSTEMCGTAWTASTATRAPTCFAFATIRATSLMVPTALEASPTATRRVFAPMRPSSPERSRVRVSRSTLIQRTVTPLSAARVTQGSTFPRWSSSVTTISSPAFQSRPRARAAWKRRVVALAPKAISPGSAWSRSAMAHLASWMYASVSTLDAKTPWTFAPPLRM